MGMQAHATGQHPSQSESIINPKSVIIRVSGSDLRDKAGTGSSRSGPLEPDGSSTRAKRESIIQHQTDRGKERQRERETEGKREIEIQEQLSTDHEGMVDLLAEQPLLGQGVAGVVSDGVDGSFLHLVLDGFEEDEDGRPGSVFQIVVHGERHPVGEHLLHHGFGAAQHQLRMFGAHRLIHQPEEEGAQDAGGVFHVAHQSYDQERCHVDSEQERKKERKKERKREK